MHDIKVNIFENVAYNVVDFSFNDPAGINNVSSPESAFTFDGLPFRGVHLSKEYGKNTIQLDGSYYLYSTKKYGGYVSRSMSDAQGYLENSVTMTITFDNVPEFLLINFDKSQEVMATELTINGTPVHNNEYSMNVNLLEYSNRNTTFTFVFTKINKAYNPLKISSVTPGLVASLDNDNIKEIKFASQLMDTSFNIEPGVVEQYAKISIIDKYHAVDRFLHEHKLRKDLHVMLYVDGNLMYTYLTSTWDIQLQTSLIVLNCNDASKKLVNQQISAQGIQDRTLSQLIQLAFMFTGYSYEYQDESTRAYVESFNIKNSYVPITTALQLLKDLCIVGMLRIYWHKNIFKIARCY